MKAKAAFPVQIASPSGSVESSIHGIVQDLLSFKGIAQFRLLHLLQKHE
jgi:hypothetical protein